MICGPVEDVNRSALINKDFLDCIVFDLNSDDHGVVLSVVEAVKVVIREGDGRHAMSVMGMGNMVDGLDMAEVFFLAEEVDPSLAKPPEIVLIAPRRGGTVGVISVRAG